MVSKIIAPTMDKTFNVLKLTTSVLATERDNTPLPRLTTQEETRSNMQTKETYYKMFFYTDRILPKAEQQKKA